MTNLKLILNYILAAVIVIIIGGLVGWYFFLYVPQTKEEVIDMARGLTGPSNPFAGGSTQKNISTILGGTEDTSTDTSSPLWQIDNTPVAGMGFVKQSTTTALYYIQRANGYVFSADPLQRSTSRLTDTLIPKVYEAFITSDGAVIERSLDEAGNITTFMATIVASSTASTTSTQRSLSGTYITKGIQSLSLSPTTRSVFYLVPNDSGGIDGIVAGWGGSKPKKIFDSNITHWTPMWLADDRLIITQNAADDLAGYSYSVANNGAMTVLVGNVPGLTLLPHPSSKTIIYGSSSRGTLSLFSQGAASTTPTTLNLQTVADKCVWLPGKVLIAYCAVPTTPPSKPFLNAWYRGEIHTSDTWWKVDVQNGVALEIYSPKRSDNVDLDVERPVIDPSGTYITFINASDKSLWMLKIPQ